MDYIVIGLGNPGLKYENTRHNAGFIAIDKLAETQNTKIDKLKFKALSNSVIINNKKVLLLKPQTFMNLSGESLKEACDFYKIPLQNIIVLVDDISLDVSKIRIRRNGSHGGQNGLRNIIDHFNSNEFTRVKIGVGKKPHPDYNLADWVLSNFTSDEQKQISSVSENVCKAVELIIDGKIDEAMNKFN